MLRRLFLAAVVTLTLCLTKLAFAGPAQTTVGVYVNQVGSVDLKNNVFTVDFWLWFKSAPRTPAPIDAFDLVDGRINSRANLIKKVLPDGQEYAAVRVNATIHSQWDLHAYPFDDHDLEIAIEEQDLDASHAVFVADVKNQGKDPGAVVSGWDLEGFDHEVTDHLYPSSYGDPTISIGSETRYSRYVGRVHARRRGLARFLKVAFPLLVSVFIAWCAFFIRPKDASPKVAISVGALFAATAGTLSINSQLPDINYATISDKTVFLCLGMIALSLLATVAALGFHYAGRDALHRRVDLLGAMVYPVVFVALLVLVVR